MQVSTYWPRSFQAGISSSRRRRERRGGCPQTAAAERGTALFLGSRTVRHRPRGEWYHTLLGARAGQAGSRGPHDRAVLREAVRETGQEERCSGCGGDLRSDGSARDAVRRGQKRRPAGCPDTAPQPRASDPSAHHAGERPARAYGGVRDRSAEGNLEHQGAGRAGGGRDRSPPRPSPPPWATQASSARAGTSPRGSGRCRGRTRAPARKGWGGSPRWGTGTCVCCSCWGLPHGCATAKRPLRPMPPGSADCSLAGRRTW